MAYNGSPIRVGWVFEAYSLSSRYYVCYLYSFTNLALSPSLLLLAVCALHEHTVHPLESLRKISKIQINFSKAEERGIKFPEGASPLQAG